VGFDAVGGEVADAQHCDRLHRLITSLVLAKPGKLLPLSSSALKLTALGVLHTAIHFEELS
jgi:hypothetical protein